MLLKRNTREYVCEQDRTAVNYVSPVNNFYAYWTACNNNNNNKKKTQQLLEMLYFLRIEYREREWKRESEEKMDFFNGLQQRKFHIVTNYNV